MESILWTAVGFAGASLTMFGFVPQVIKMWRTKLVRDVSLPTLLQISLGASLWILYGNYIRDIVVITANVVTLSTLIIAIILYFHYRGAQ